MSTRVLKTSSLDGMVDGRAEIFERLVRAHQDRVFNFCFRMLGSREEALDLAQETFASVYLNLEGFRQDSLLSTWILKIAKNLSLNRMKYLRRRGSGRSAELTSVPEAELHQSQPGAIGAQEALEVADERAAVQAAIAELPEEQRLLVVLRDIEGLSYTDIAQVAELPEGTVRSRLHRAREKLAQLLEKREVDGGTKSSAV